MAGFTPAFTAAAMAAATAGPFPPLPLLLSPLSRGRFLLADVSLLKVPVVRDGTEKLRIDLKLGCRLGDDESDRSKFRKRFSPRGARDSGVFPVEGGSDVIEFSFCGDLIVKDGFMEVSYSPDKGISICSPIGRKARWVY